mmetsp:Transcript_103214/g.268810  ORF Transcript_103214/g.268810 Transcript_103214/m.268810 type:complete len:108 (+) Transcript_103214:325-648(+)
MNHSMHDTHENRVQQFRKEVEDGSVSSLTGSWLKEPVSGDWRPRHSTLHFARPRRDWEDPVGSGVRVRRRRQALAHSDERHDLDNKAQQTSDTEEEMFGGDPLRNKL